MLERLAGLQHTRELLDDLGAELRKHLWEAPAELRLGRQSVDLGEPAIDAQEAQLGVVEGETDRGGLEDDVEQRPRRLLLDEPLSCAEIDHEPEDRRLAGLDGERTDEHRDAMAIRAHQGTLVRRRRAMLSRLGGGALVEQAHTRRRER